jgi:putative redox protein
MPQAAKGASAMVVVEGRYIGNLRCEATHGPSKSKIVTDAPVDNMGRGEAFSPTDLVGTALGTCIVTTMAIVAQRRDIAFEGATFRVEKHMATEPVRHIGRLIVTIHMPPGLTEEQRTILERAAHACPVHRSLGSNVEAPIEFVYE